MIVMIAATQHLELIGLGHSIKDAQDALLNRWKKHCDVVPAADPGYMQELIDSESVQVVELEPGTAVVYGGQ